MRDVVIDTVNGLVHMESGETVPVTSWLDIDGDDCSPSDAAALVCGPNKSGMWMSLEVFPEESGLEIN